MDTLQKEIAELKEFIAELKADRAAAKEKERRETWTKYVSLTVVVVAVIAAVAAQWSGKYGGQVQISQVKASDQWAFYQSKSIKQHMDEVALAELTHDGEPTNPDTLKEVQKLRADLARYDKEKSDIKTQAEALEKVRDDAGKRGGKMGFSVTLFSVAIATASLCTVTKKKPLWFASMVMAFAAITQMVRAWL